MDTLKNVCDSVATCVNGMAEGCQPIVKVSETNCADVSIVNIICNTIQTIALYAIVCFFVYKASECILSCIDNYIKRKHDKADRKWNQKTNYITRMLDLQKDYAEIKYNDDGKKKDPKYDDKRYGEYKKSLEDHING